MAVEKMSFVNIIGPLSKFEEISDLCIASDAFHPENAISLVDGIKGFVPFSEENPYANTLKMLEDYSAKTGRAFKFEDFESLNISNQEIEDKITEILAKFSELNEQRQLIDKNILDNEQIIKQLLPLRPLEIKLDYLFNLKYLIFSFGRMPYESYEKLKLYLADSDFFFFPAEIQKEYVWGMYLSPRSISEKTDSVFKSLQFEKIVISEKVHGTPKNAFDEISHNIENQKKDLLNIQNEITKYLDEHEVFINSSYSMIKYRHDKYELRRYAAHSNNNFYVSGWIPEENSEAFSKKFDDISSVSCVIEHTSEVNVAPPIKLKNPGIFKPFEQFVSMYGLPSYNEIDPTPFLAVTYILMFGLMFGDIGQGAVLFIGGLLLWKLKKMPFGRIISTLGVSSIVFGFVYGSLFGIELKGFKPMEEVNLTLGIPIILGIVMISAAMIVNIINGIKQKNIEKALFSPHGVAGIVFYWGIMFAIIFIFLFNKSLFNVWYIALFAILPLVLIFLKEPLSNLIKRKPAKPENIVEFCVENFFELFETMLSMMSNTISFVRVGAYALSHAGMMLVVFMISEMVGAGANIAIIVFGNALVIVLEGLLSGIQVLRLEFYEMFSRFYSGDGKEYEPFKISKTF